MMVEWSLLSLFDFPDYMRDLLGTPSGAWLGTAGFSTWVHSFIEMTLTYVCSYLKLLTSFELHIIAFLG